jgi:hypothetical protein
MLHLETIPSQAQRDTRDEPVKKRCGVEPGVSGKIQPMKKIHEEDEADLHGEVSRSLAFVGAATSLIVEGGGGRACSLMTLGMCIGASPRCYGLREAWPEK